MDKKVIKHIIKYEFKNIHNNQKIVLYFKTSLEVEKYYINSYWSVKKSNHINVLKKHGLYTGSIKVYECYPHTKYIIRGNTYKNYYTINIEYNDFDSSFLRKLKLFKIINGDIFSKTNKRLYFYENKETVLLRMFPELRYGNINLEHKNMIYHTMLSESLPDNIKFSMKY